MFFFDERQLKNESLDYQNIFFIIFFINVLFNYPFIDNVPNFYFQYFNFNYNMKAVNLNYCIYFLRYVNCKLLYLFSTLCQLQIIVIFLFYQLYFIYLRINEKQSCTVAPKILFVCLKNTAAV